MLEPPPVCCVQRARATGRQSSALTHARMLRLDAVYSQCCAFTWQAVEGHVAEVKAGVDGRGHDDDAELDTRASAGTEGPEEYERSEAEIQSDHDAAWATSGLDNDEFSLAMRQMHLSALELTVAADANATVLDQPPLLRPRDGPAVGAPHAHFVQPALEHAKDPARAVGGGGGGGVGGAEMEMEVDEDEQLQLALALSLEPPPVDWDCMIIEEHGSGSQATSAARSSRLPGAGGSRARSFSEPSRPMGTSSSVIDRRPDAEDLDEVLDAGGREYYDRLGIDVDEESAIDVDEIVHVDEKSADAMADELVERGAVQGPEDGFPMYDNAMFGTGAVAAPTVDAAQGSEGGYQRACNAARRSLRRPRRIDNKAPLDSAALASKDQIAATSEASAQHGALVVEAMADALHLETPEQTVAGLDLYNREVAAVHNASWFHETLYFGRSPGVWRHLKDCADALQKAHARILSESRVLAARFALSIQYDHWPTYLQTPSSGALSDPDVSLVAVVTSYPSGQETPPGVQILDPRGEQLVDESGKPVTGTGFMQGVCCKFVSTLYQESGARATFFYMLFEFLDMQAVYHYRLHAGGTFPLRAVLYCIVVSRATKARTCVRNRQPRACAGDKPWNKSRHLDIRRFYRALTVISVICVRAILREDERLPSGVCVCV